MVVDHLSQEDYRHENMKNNKCKICRRLGEKLFLKGEKCSLSKCSMVRKPYPPGQKGKRGRKTLSEYGKELKEKQKLKNWYSLKEKQFRKYVKEALRSRRNEISPSRFADACVSGKVENASGVLVQILESRLDNIIFRLGFAGSRALARQIVSHGHILVNDKRVNIASFLIKKGDRINIKPSSIEKSVFRILPSILKKHKSPSWLELSVEKLEGKVLEIPNLEEAGLNVEISSIFEHYSR